MFARIYPIIRKLFHRPPKLTRQQRRHVERERAKQREQQFKRSPLTMHVAEKLH